MAAIGEQIYSRLTTHSDVAALVGNRVYPIILPQDPTLPAITYQIISQTPTGGNIHLHNMRLQVDCWSTSYAGADGLAAKVIAALRLYGERSNQRPLLMSAYDVNRQDLFEPDTNEWRVSIDFQCQILT